MSWLELLWQASLTIAVLISTAVTIFLITLPKQFSHFRPGLVKDQNFDDEDKADPERSGYSYFTTHKDEDGTFQTDCSVQVIVLGDIGRSPRMQYHALSIAAHGGRVDIVGYEESELHPDVVASRFINVVPIAPYPDRLRTTSKASFPLIAPLKVLWQVWSLYHALGYRSRASKWMLVQNPPSIPTLIVAQFVCFFRNTKLVVDWHNFGYSILALRLGSNHRLVSLSEWYEGYFGRAAVAHFAVTDAMVKVLKQKWNISAKALHDRPPRQFQPLTNIQRSALLSRLDETAQHARDLEVGKWRLLVSSTSWTSDEDFSLLLDALVGYSNAVELDRQLPRILAIITGKGPEKAWYLERIRVLKKEKKLRHVIITTAWLSIEDYALLLGSADLGVSLHTSSSGVDLPMKVVDMFGTGLPVVGWSKFEAWPELVKESVNGCGFESADGLADLLINLFSNQAQKLQKLKVGALKECERRWDDDWMPVAGQLFGVKP
ncbi:glycosyltransferase family 33 protein [Polychaeton citri CBS 116435]|uniref:Chitobiosyldiphosphodolichol beta-mannosyltransferase n=1 Tax=Polychaeton citri CBS 116435 TaxID=1314669 RepID=A0A9P4UMZ2_9PEZI|nr:glycosyltransferase family 33 protein [Polychaeton citri CBS 116435]